MKLTLPNGATGFTDDSGKWVCTGSQMGRPNRVPSGGDRMLPVKMRLIRLPFVDDCYDRWGAYWGCPETVWMAESVDALTFGDSLQTAQLFIRADSRDEAKTKVREQLPNARFYR